MAKSPPKQSPTRRKASSQRPPRAERTSRSSLSGAETKPRRRDVSGTNEKAPSPQASPARAAPTRPAPRRPPSPPAREATPPKTFWERVKRYLKPPRKLKFTREGKYYLGITLGVGFAAINTGNNLLYLLLGMLLSLIVVSGAMSDLSLRHLTVTRRLPTRAQVGRAHLVEIEVFNHKGRVPSYAIEVEDLRSGQPADKRCFFLKISPTSAQVAAYRRTPARRGRDRHTGFRIATRFPFGLFEKSREVESEGELIIYPAVDPVRLPMEDRGRNIGGVGSIGRGTGDDTFGLRLMREGDDPRDIYWRKSTMSDQIVLRERSRETRPDVELTIDTVRPKGADETFDATFEKRIREVASRAVAHIKRGDGVMIRTTVGERARADRSLGSDPVLRFLALLETVDEERAKELRASRLEARRLHPPVPDAREGEATLPSVNAPRRARKARGRAEASGDAPSSEGARS